MIMVLVGSAAYADSSSLNLALPGVPQSYQYDKFKAGDLDCSNAIGSATQFEFGVTGIINREDDPFDGNYDTGRTGDVGVYGRITIPIGAPKERINCNELYELELKKKRLEVMKLERELQQLRNLQFEE
jgi:hypothetical protein